MYLEQAVREAYPGASVVHCESQQVFLGITMTGDMRGADYDEKNIPLEIDGIKVINEDGWTLNRTVRDHKYISYQDWLVMNLET